jgi:uncharacterized membrane-anchored protein YjiN (DUF445 family)
MAATILTGDEQRRADLRRMKTLATGLLLLAAAVYVVASRAGHGGAAGWVGYVRAAAEAAMVGALADWFAVTALFRHPLGLPIPHTAIIPTRKDAMGQGLSDFVGTHFLSEEVVRGRLRTVGVAGRVGEWLAAPEHAERVTAETAALVRGAMGVLRDEDVRAVLEQTIVPRLLATEVGPPLGRLLARVVEDGAHEGLVQLVIDKTDEWLVENEDLVIGVVSQQAPAWSPRFVDEKVAQFVYHELRRVAGEVRADRHHPLRGSLDRFLLELAADLRKDPATIARLEELKAQLLSHPDVRGAMGELSSTVRAMITEAVDNPRSELRIRVSSALVRFGRRLHTDHELRAKVDGWIEDAAAHLVTTYRDELTTTITETVNRWDGEETARKVELAVGRDLQFIRINGTVVGALAGVAIHVASQLL